MKIFSDLHLDNSNKAYRRSNDGKSELLAAQEQFLIDLFESADPDELIVCSGDLTDSNLLDSYVFGAVQLFASLVSEHKGQVILLEGNHCITDSKNVYSVVGGLERLRLPNLICAHRPTSLIATDKDRTVAIHAVPYMDDHDAMLAAMAAPSWPNDKTLGPDTTKYLFFHAAVRNALLDNGFPNERGIELTADQVLPYDVIIGGDFHRHQCFEVAGKQVYYCGAPFTLRAGQEYPKGHMTAEGSKLTFVTCLLDRPIISRRYDELPDLELPDDASRITLRIKDVPSHTLKLDLAKQLESLGLYDWSIALLPSSPTPVEGAPIVYSALLTPEQNTLLAIDRHLEGCDPDDPLKQNAEMVKKLIGKSK